MFHDYVDEIVDLWQQGRHVHAAQKLSSNNSELAVAVAVAVAQQLDGSDAVQFSRLLERRAKDYI